MLETPPLSAAYPDTLDPNILVGADTYDDGDHPIIQLNLTINATLGESPSLNEEVPRTKSEKNTNTSDWNPEEMKTIEEQQVLQWCSLTNSGDEELWNTLEIQFEDLPHQDEFSLDPPL